MKQISKLVDENRELKEKLMFERILLDRAIEELEQTKQELEELKENSKKELPYIKNTRKKKGKEQ